MRYMMSEDWEDGERDIYSVKWYKGMYLEHRKVLNRAVAYENRFDGPLVCRTNERRLGKKNERQCKVMEIYLLRRTFRKSSLSCCFFALSLSPSVLWNLKSISRVLELVALALRCAHDIAANVAYPESLQRVIVVRRTEHRWRELEMMKKGCVLCSIYGFYQRSMPNNAVEIGKHHYHAIAPARCERTDVHTIPKCRSCLRPKGHGKYPERRASPSCMNTKGLLLGIPL